MEDGEKIEINSKVEEKQIRVIERLRVDLTSLVLEQEEPSLNSSRVFEQQHLHRAKVESCGVV